MNPLSIIGLGTGILGGIGSLFGAGKANSSLNQLLSQDPSYTANPIAAQRLGLAQQLLNARQPGMANAERNIYGAQANTVANNTRAASDGSQLLAANAGALGQTNQAFENLGQQENAGYMQRVQNLAGAQQGEISEGDKVYQDQIRRFSDLAQIRGAQNQNRQQAWNSISNAGFGIANFGIASRGFGMNGVGNNFNFGSSNQYPTGQSGGGMYPYDSMPGDMQNYQY